MHFGQTLRVLRTTAKLSLRELSRQIGVSPAYLSQVETGKIAPPSPERIRAIESALGVPDCYLLSVTARVDANVADLLHNVPPVIDFLRAALQAGLNGQDFQSMITLLKSQGAEGMRRALKVNATFDLHPDAATDVRYVSNYLVEERVGQLTGVKNKEALFDLFSERVLEHVEGWTRQAVLEELWTREREASTGIGSGIAVPHASHAALKKTVVLLVVLDPAVDYGAIDGEPVDICFLVLAPESARREHLEVLARVTQVCSHPSFTRGVRTANTPAEILEFVKLCAARIP